MSGPGPNRILIAREGGGEQGANVQVPVPDCGRDVVRHCSAAASSELAAEAEQGAGQNRNRQGYRLARERRHAARKLGDDVVRRQGEPRDRRTFECLFQVEDEREKAALQCHSRAELGAGSQYGVPAFISGGLQLFAAAGGRWIYGIFAFGYRREARLTVARKTLYYRGSCYNDGNRVCIVARGEHLP